MAKLSSFPLGHSREAALYALVLSFGVSLKADQKVSDTSVLLAMSVDRTVRYVPF